MARTVARRWDAVLWDLDGTLVDTEPFWIETESELVAAYGGRWTHEDGLRLVGSDLLDAATYLRDHAGVDLPPAEIVQRLLDGVEARLGDRAPWRPGARELLLALRDDGVPCGLVTMSYRRNVDPIVRQLPEGTFGAVVTGDTVTRGKPDPEPYLTAAAALGVDPTRCLAIEDSETGTRAAESAGCTVAVVAHHVPVPPGARRVLLPTLAGVAPADLPTLVPDPAGRS